MSEWTPTIGARVRVLRQIEKQYRDHTFTVRCEPRPSHLYRDRRISVWVDDGDPHNSDAHTNGATIVSWVAVASIEPWGDAPERASLGARHAAESRVLRETVATLRDENERLRAEIERLRIPAPGSRWWHFKGNLYRIERVIDGVVHYVAEHDGGRWTRLLAGWHEHVERPDWNYSGPRFVEVAGG